MVATQQYYLSHLTEVNKSNTIILAEDVFNDRGVLVVKKGGEVNKIFAQKIAKHKLLKPIDHSISLTSTLNQRTLFDFYSRSLDNMKLSNIVRHNGMRNDALEAFHLLNQYPLIIQKLTILAERMPEVLKSSLLTSVLALSLCRELKLSKQTAECVFVAGVIANVGLLHIDPLIVNKKGHYTQDERNLMKGHVVIAKYFADSVPSLHKLVAKAVLEHHERADGFGYPFAKQASQLGIEGQILAMVDKVNAIYQKLVRDCPHSWTSVIAVIQVPSTAHAAPLNNAMMRVLKGFSVKYEAAFSKLEFKKLVKKCIVKRERLHLWFREFARIYNEHPTLMVESVNFKPLALLHQLEYTVNNSGVLNEALHTWLVQLPENLLEADCLDVEEFALVLDEVEYQCVFVMRKLGAAKDEFAKRFDDPELADLYYQGLTCILDPNSNNSFK